MTRIGLLVLRRDVVRAQVGVIALLLQQYLLYESLLLPMMVMVLLVLHSHRRSNGDTLGYYRRSNFVD